jgi:hypothetical protein
VTNQMVRENRAMGSNRRISACLLLAFQDIVEETFCDPVHSPFCTQSGAALNSAHLRQEYAVEIASACPGKFSFSFESSIQGFDGTLVAQELFKYSSDGGWAGAAYAS